MKHLRVHPLMPLDVHLLVLAFLVGIQLALLMRAREALARADDEVSDLTDTATEIVDHAEQLAADVAAGLKDNDEVHIVVDSAGEATVTTKPPAAES